MCWYPLTFEPVLREKAWGGRRLESVLGKSLPPNTLVGESWEVSDQEGDVTMVAAGPLAGRPLHDLVKADAPGLVGRPLRPREGGRFPLLAKFIDARDALSVQVHADEAAARRMGAGARPKTECWYVVHVDTGAYLYLGTKPGVTREAVGLAVRSDARDRVDAVLNRMEVRAGDFLFAPAGTVHAIGAGMLFAEVSETSDTTLRLYDWGRLPRRPVHVEAALAALHVYPDGLGPAGRRTPRPIAPHRSRLLECEAFTVDLLRLPAGESCEEALGGLCAVWMTVEGRGTLTAGGAAFEAAAGRTFLLPAALGEVAAKAEAAMTVLLCRPPA